MEHNQAGEQDYYRHPEMNVGEDLGPDSGGRMSEIFVGQVAASLIIRRRLERSQPLAALFARKWRDPSYHNFGLVEEIPLRPSLRGG
jgi:hypothetical protein